MDTVSFCFGIFGFLAFCYVIPLQSRISKLEKQLSLVKGTSFYDERESLREAIGAYIGKSVKIDMREEEPDADIVNYGNTKYGKNVIIDADDEWVLVEITSAKGTKEKLLRISSIRRITEETSETQKISE